MRSRPAELIDWTPVPDWGRRVSSGKEGVGGTAVVSLGQEFGNENLGPGLSGHPAMVT